MRVTNQELLFFNSLTGGGPLLGIHLEIPKREKREQFIEDTIASLKKKRVLSEDGQLRKVGAIPVYVLEQYKTAKCHVIINQLKIALLPEGKTVVIIPSEGQYELEIINNIDLFKQILVSYEFLRLEEPEKERNEERRIEYDTWLEEIKGYGHSHMLIGSFQDKIVIEESVLYGDNKKGYSYDLHSGIRKETGPLSMRKYLMKLLNIPLAINI